jgi:subfamily B ATP-binding cassette protein MsbA
MSVLHRLLKNAYPYRRALHTSIIFMISSIIMEMAGYGLGIPALFWFISSGGSGQKSMTMPDYPGLKNIIDYILTFDNIKVLIFLCIFTALTLFMKCGFDALANYQMQKYSNQVGRDLRQRLFNHFLSLNLSIMENHKSGSLLSRISSDVTILQTSLIPQLSGAIKAILTITVSLVTMLMISWKLSIFIFIIIPIVIFINNRAGKKVRAFTASIYEKLAELNGFIIERLVNLRVVQSFTREKYESDKVTEYNSRFYKEVMKSARVTETLNPSVEYTASFGLVLIIFGCGYAVFNSAMPSLLFLSFIAVAQRGGSNFRTLSQVNMVREQAEGTGKKIFELLDTPPDILDNDNAEELPEVQGLVDFKDVSFHYNAGDDILKSINMVVQPGEIIAIVGPSGAGKTTLANLIPRFYSPTSGEILIDGYNIADVTLYSLRSQIGNVPQETMLFSGNIYDNIIYGKVGATTEEVFEAAKLANVMEFVNRLPDGFQTIIGERGSKLSGGQRQRIAIARALLKNPRILILDEATSSLDTESEHLVQQALERLMINRTTFVIAHRLSTIKNANRIIVLEKGKIVESGTHQELLDMNGLYKKLYEIQFRTQEEKVAVCEE